MKLRYSYHSEHNADQQDRWIHFVLFIGALALALAAVQQFYVQFFSWQAAEEESYLHLILGIAYGFITAVLIFWGVRLRNASRGEADRYVRINDEKLTWDLTQVDGEQKISLSDIKRVDRKSIRDLALTLKSGQTIMLPIYLIANHDKQEELLRVLWEIIPVETPPER